jgi:hypothetical protein
VGGDEWLRAVMDVGFASNALFSQVFFFFFQGEQVTRAESSNKSHPSKAQARGWRNLTVATL